MSWCPWVPPAVFGGLLATTHTPSWVRGGGGGPPSPADPPPPAPPQHPAALAAGLVAGIVAGGLLLAAGGRGWAELHDRREVRRFEQERRRARWDEVRDRGGLRGPRGGCGAGGVPVPAVTPCLFPPPQNNPLFRSATTTVVNPSYCPQRGDGDAGGPQ